MSELWGTSSQLYWRVDALLREIANPKLPDIPTNLPFRVELWDRNDQHIRRVVSASASVTIAHAALDAAIANYPRQRFTAAQWHIGYSGAYPSLIASQSKSFRRHAGQPGRT